MKVEFQGANKLIVVNYEITELDVQVDLYSDWKEFIKESDNSKYLPAIRTVGGDPTTGTKSVAPYFFLMNGWKIRPYEGDHILTLAGNLFVDNPETYGYNPCVPTVGDYNVTINMSTTSDAIVSQVGSGLSADEHDKLYNLHDEAFGKWVVNPTAKTLTLYKVDGVTILKVFNLTETTETVPAFVERVPV